MGTGIESEINADAALAWDETRHGDGAEAMLAVIYSEVGASGYLVGPTLLSSDAACCPAGEKTWTRDLDISPTNY